MDIRLPESTLRQYLDTGASTKKIAEALSLCGPTVDRIDKVKGNIVYEIEVITNRVDSASAFGIAREAASILPQFGVGAALKNNPYDLLDHELPEPHEDKLSLNIQLLDQSLVPHFAAVVLDKIQVKDSPATMQKELELSGQRPLNNLIDITNYLTLCLGQPVHIFDYDKIGKATMKVRTSKKGEKITTLDGRTHILRGGDIVIEDGNGNLIDLCGIMGGDNSKVDENTTRVVLFVQTYDPKKIRTTSLYTQERTLAAQLFEKKPDRELVIPTLLRGIELLQSLANGTQVSKIIDIYPDPSKRQQVCLNLSWLNRFLGIEIPQIDILEILASLGFEPEINEDRLTCMTPTWRLHDISLPEDLAEEIARVYGYFRFPGKLPTSTLPRVSTHKLLDWETNAKQYLADLGFTEVLTSSLISESLRAKANTDDGHILKLTNPLSEDYTTLRTSLIPGALQTLATNLGKTDLPYRIFELSNIYKPYKDLAEEIPMLTITTYGLDWKTTKGYLEALALHLRLGQISYKAVKESSLFIASHAAEVSIKDQVIGQIGEVSPEIKNKFGLIEPVYIVDLCFQKIAEQAGQKLTIKPLLKYPPIIEDLTLQSDKLVGVLYQIIKQQPFVDEVKYITSFNDKHTFRITFVNPDKMLTHEEVEPIKNKIISQA